MLKTLKHQSLGFSLLELLVVISIIGILLSIGTVSFISAQKQARDSRRFQDLKAIQTAQEQYLAKNGSSYYYACGSGSCTATSIPEVMDQFPTDPKNVTPYQYTGRSNSSITKAYCVDALLETATGNCGGCAACPTPDNCPMNAGTTHFCVKNLQTP